MILIFSDLHLGSGNGAKRDSVEERGSMLRKQVEIAREIRAVADGHRVAHIFFLGDMIDCLMGHMTEQVYQGAWKVARLLAERSQLWMVLGNHDVWGDLVEQARLRSIPNTRIINRTTSERIEGIQVDFVPWNQELPARKGEMLAGHLSVYGSYVGPSSAFRCKAGIAEHDLLYPRQLEGYDRVFLGHNHFPQELRIQGAKEARYVGAVMPPRSESEHKQGFAYLLKDGETFKVDISEPGTFLGGVTGHVRKGRIS